MEGLLKINQENKVEMPKIKEGVDFVFEQNLELAQIGTKEQYSEYLDSVFPESKVKDIVYHGSNNEFDNFEKRNREDKFDAGTIGNGIYFGESATAFDSNPKYTKISILDTKNPLINVDEIILHIGERESNSNNDRYTGNHIIYNEYELKRRFYTENKDYFNIVSNFIKEQNLEGKIISDFEISELYSEYLIKLGYDGIVSNGTSAYCGGKEFVVFEPEQIHILGSKQDIDEFRKFVEN